MSQNWNGVELLDYPQGYPELTVVKYIISSGEKLGIIS